MLNPRDREILDLFCEGIRKQFPEARIYAFGSRSRGDHQPDSDLDICVILNNVDWHVRKSVSHVAWEVGFEKNLLITTVVFSADQFYVFPGAANPLVQSILEDGIAA